MINQYRPQRSLRSLSQNLLAVPKTKTVTYGERIFNKSAPALWNILPVSVKECTSVYSFKHQLKTYLFTYLWTWVIVMNSIISDSWKHLKPCIIIFGYPIAIWENQMKQECFCAHSVVIHNLPRGHYRSCCQYLISDTTIPRAKQGLELIPK